MKILITILFAITASPAFAGNLYFICSHITDETTQEEEFIVDSLIDDEDSSIHATFGIPSQPGLLYSVEYLHSTREFKAKVKSFKSIKPLDQMSTTIKINHPVKLSSRLSCGVQD